MELLPASAFSIEQLTEAYNQTRVDYLVPMPMSVARLRDYIRNYDIDLDASVVAVDGSEMLGLCMLGLRPGRAWITRLGVLPASRRQGSAFHMMNWCLDRARERGMAYTVLEVIEGNEPAHALFTRLGFRATRRLLILRRPPGPVDAPSLDGIQVLDSVAALEVVEQRQFLPAWTNQSESLAHAGGIEAFECEGLWLCFKPSALQLTRVILGPEDRIDSAMGLQLLSALHSAFPRLDSVAENVPLDHAGGLEAYQRIGYVESFRRIEMVLEH